MLIVVRVVGLAAEALKSGEVGEDLLAGVVDGRRVIPVTREAVVGEAGDVCAEVGDVGGDSVDVSSRRYK